MSASVKRRSTGARVEDQWHRSPRNGETVFYPADNVDGPLWCTNRTHYKTPGTAVCTKLHEKGRRWRVRWVNPDGKELTESYKNRADADRRKRQLDSDLHTGTYVDPAAGQVTFREYAEAWRKRQVHRGSSADSTESRLRLHVYPVLGDRAVSSILPSEIQAWVAGIELAPSTVGVLHGIVYGIFKDAVRDKRIASNPCEGTKLPKVAPRKIVPPTTEQFETVRSMLPAELRALATFAAGTGMRKSECFGLVADRLHLPKEPGDRSGTVKVDQQLVRANPLTFGPPKTQASYRTIPLPDVVVAALKDHLAQYPLGPEGLVFTWRGKPIPRSSFDYHWTKAARAANLPPRSGLHSLRHYYASLLIRYGESVKTVQARLGHASAAETLDTYSHLWPDSDDRTRDAIDSVLG
ncbi:tyrosine-type recombinase/integrase [Mycobacterium avium]|uniref:tyrosine-type recombinase/integrase n=1 Tax=Mycobacterium avium TaxID=1764 RepID=UPI0007A08B29|nr:site-specific integrase [Mycobacterium avium]MBZ4542271.1 site-specific integrase [Mycobacterium avium subsp. hominissuis]